MKGTDKKWATIYWVGTIVQMLVVCSVKALLRVLHIQAPEIVNTLFLIIGGGSSAIWGAIVSIKSKRVDSIAKIAINFIDVRQSVVMYVIVAIFLAVIFVPQLLFGFIVDGVTWNSFIILFFIAVLFGGIEEIGWRYTFQTMVENKLPFSVASVLTFISWGLWHYMYFYLTDSLQSVHHVSFLIGLLGGCFILGAIHKISNSLWLCVLYHSLWNAFAQTIHVNGLYVAIICNLLCIVLSITLVKINMTKRTRA